MPATSDVAVLFDLDGTLLDTIDLLLDSMSHAFAGRTIVPSRAEWTASIGTPLRGQMRHWGVGDHEIEQVVARYRAHQDAHLERMTRVYPGTHEVLQWARAQGHALGVVTSKGRGMTERSLRHVGLADAFDLVVTADDTTRHKPDPEPVRQALAQLRITPDRALFVGDSTHDMHAGRAAGTATGAALWGPFSREALAVTRPSYWLHSLGEVPSAVTRLATP